ncbi:dynein assembly factor with WDR repeat domains 1-like [Spea bombifrons]|uniref:dynein assembly factor with WDR repeat domains 1-like n=1 Tax=Spea bombifrons TaxID=233779 RepID=UPI00234A7A4D|nr:dynein assembly factor with WDR repeat domains 1-like [Spea bombifrons]
MAMQKHLSIRDCHPRAITALGFHSAKREFLTGFEDGVIKWWDLDSGRLSQSASEHSGMVTSLLYWAQTRLVLSSSNDGFLIVWTSGAVVLDKIKLGSPIFSIAINLRRHLLVCGFSKHLSVYPLDEQKASGHMIDLKKKFSDNVHTDIVSCVLCLDSQIYTVGYDRKFIIFDTYQTPEKMCLKVVHCNSHAHEAGITHLLLVREHESTRFLTGSFDGTVGVWSQDGQLIQRLRNFTGVITGICYVAPVKTVWITSGIGHPLLLDPRSGDIDPVDTTRSLFTDEMDVLVMAATNGDIYLWEFDESETASIPDETAEPDDSQNLMKKYEHFLAPESIAESPIGFSKKSHVLNKHLVGMTCRNVLAGHFKTVTALAIIGKECGFNTVYLLSGGWDRRLCVWDLEKCTLIETFSRPEQEQWSELKEVACDGYIMDICYSPKRKEFAYASSDGKIYIRNFSTVSSEMTLVNILIGHEAEVTTVIWHHLIDKWISGSEDGTIRIWSEHGAHCEKVLVTKEVVTCLCIDKVNGCIVAGVQDTIR